MSWTRRMVSPSIPTSASRGGSARCASSSNRRSPRAASPELVPRLTRRFQERLVTQGIPLYWLVDVPPADPGFTPVQLLATWGVWPGAPDDLEFHPDAPADLAALRRELGPAGPMLPAELPEGI